LQISSSGTPLQLGGGLLPGVVVVAVVVVAVDVMVVVMVVVVVVVDERVVDVMVVVVMVVVVMVVVVIGGYVSPGASVGSGHASQVTGHDTCNESANPGELHKAFRPLAWQLRGSATSLQYNLPSSVSGSPSLVVSVVVVLVMVEVSPGRVVTVVVVVPVVVGQ
jgi:hypothetical protein